MNDQRDRVVDGIATLDVTRSAVERIAFQPVAQLDVARNGGGRPRSERVGSERRGRPAPFPTQRRRSPTHLTSLDGLRIDGRADCAGDWERRGDEQELVDAVGGAVLGERIDPM